MYKNASYKEKYAHLSEWMPFIIDTIKKDLKNDHLKKDFYFIKKFLSSKNIQKVTVEELTKAYSRAIAEEENREEIGEFVTTRWLLKNTDLYEFFEKYLNQVSPDFTSLEELDLEHSQKLIDASNQQFGAARTYIFSVLNSVVFPQEIFQQLKEQAQIEKQQQQEHQQLLSEKMIVKDMQESFKHEIARLTDKYEKKLAGLEKKYLIDTEGLKKQIKSLQRQCQSQGKL